MVTAAQKIYWRAALALLACTCVTWAAEPDSALRDSGQEELHQAVAACAAAPLQVTYEIAQRAGKPSSEPATKAEAERVRAILQEAKLSDDPGQQRATYETTLSMLRAVPVLRFRIEPHEDSAALTQTRQCLERLAKDVGFLALFSAPPRKARKSK